MRWRQIRFISVATLICCAPLLTSSDPTDAAPVWLGATKIATAKPSFNDPQVTLDERGNAIVLWEGIDNGIQTALRPGLGGRWQAPIVLSQGVGEVTRPVLATNSAGSLIAAAWGRGGAVNSSEASAQGFTWKAPTMLSPESQGAGRPQLAVDPQGDEVAVWEAVEAHERTIQASYRPATSRVWNSPMPLSLAWPPYRGGGEPSVAMDSRGDAVATWERLAEGSWTIEAAVRPAGEGAWQAPTPISGAFQQPAVSGGALLLGVRVAVDAQGDAVAVWEHYMRDNWFIEAAVRPASSQTWQTPLRLSTAGLGGAQPDLALDPQGDAIVVWEGATSTERTVEVATGSALSGTWQAPRRLAAWPHTTPPEFHWIHQVGSAGVSPGANPEVALNGQGEAIAAWEHSGSSYEGLVQAAVKPAATAKWQPPVNLAAASTGGVQVALSATGEAVVVWNRLLEGEDDPLEADVLATLGVTSVSLSHRRFRVRRPPNQHGPKAPRGTRFRFVLSEPAELKVAITGSVPGVSVRGGCVSPTVAMPKRVHGDICSRSLSYGTLTALEPAGRDSMYFSGRLDGVPLKPGAYHATLTASSANVVSSPVELAFLVARN
jgi:hypothetical protein